MKPKPGHKHHCSGAAAFQRQLKENCNCPPGFFEIKREKLTWKCPIAISSAIPTGSATFQGKTAWICQHGESAHCDWSSHHTSSAQLSTPLQHWVQQCRNPTSTGWRRKGHNKHGCGVSHQRWHNVLHFYHLGAIRKHLLCHRIPTGPEHGSPSAPQKAIRHPLSFL